MVDSFKKSDYLTYTGGATIREVTKDQWETAGVENQDRVEWTPRNPSVKVGDMSADAVRLLLERHPNEFRIDSDKTPAPNGE